MKIVFDDRPGKIYDIFNSLWFINNYEYAKTRKENFGVYIDNKYEKALISIAENNKIDMEKVNKYFPEELQPQTFLNFSNLWKFSHVSDYLEYIRGLDKFQLRQKIVNCIQLITEPEEPPLKQSLVEKYAIDDMSIFNYIEDKDISVELKWEIFLLLKNKDKYLDEYIQFISSYLKIYEGLEDVKQDIIAVFNQEFEKNIHNSGVDFLNHKIDHFYDFSKCENISITSSVISSLIVNDNYLENCYVVVGPYIDDVIKNYKGQNDVENSLSVIKTICDNTRFQIIKLLQERDYYGQEIADALDLSKSTISHHMFNLSMANVININRDSQKYFYSINTDELEKNIAILVKELNLKI